MEIWRRYSLQNEVFDRVLPVDGAPAFFGGVPLLVKPKTFTHSLHATNQNLSAHTLPCTRALLTNMAFQDFILSLLLSTAMTCLAANARPKLEWLLVSVAA